VNSTIRELTSLRRLDRESAPLRLYEKAKRLGTWNPSGIDLTRDREEWARLTEAGARPPGSSWASSSGT
jgi:ribonucleoside-diphosphate reductase beta chain